MPLTRFVGPDVLVRGDANTIAFEHDAALRKQVFGLFATNHGPEGQATKLAELLCCLPGVETPSGVGYRDVFRVLIVQFMDALSLDIRALKKSCIHMAQPDGRLIPFESFNLFYRDDLRQRLDELRAEVAAATAQRLARF